MTQLSWGEVCARRLARHGLNAPVRGARPADVVSGMCGAHAQVMSAAELSIGLRSADIRLTEVRDALWTERTLVKTRGPRGTVHLLASRDLPMWTGALSAIPAMPVSLPEGVAMTPSQTEAVLTAIADALDDATLTVDELTEAIVARVGPWAGDRVLDAFQDKWPRWRLIENAATNRGVMCFGPNKGRKVAYTSPRRWLPGFYPTEPSVALADLVKRYLHAYGPATPQQFAQWLNAPRPWALAHFFIKEGVVKLQAYLNFDGNCAEAFRFYEQVLGGKATIQSFRDSPMAGGTAEEHLDRTLHASLEVGDQVIMGSDSWPGQHATPQGFAVSISVNDEGEAERIFSQLSENGTVQMPLQETFWAPRFGMLVDRYGTPWMISGETAA